ncbi:MAG: aspartyl/asparaginyl beta-hydroxylase domain-containing protein [Polyangiaceae bacterium]
MTDSQSHRLHRKKTRAPTFIKAPAAVALARTYDSALLRADYETLAGISPRQQPGPYHAGGWRGLSLIAPGGRSDWAGACMPTTMLPGKTHLLRSTPHLARVLDELPCQIVSARLLTLEPGERIRPHCDSMMDLSAGMARMHVPIITDARVEFVVDGDRYALEPGTLWYADFSKTHSVANPTRITRVHLVIDALASDRLLKLFPERFLASLSEDDVFAAPDAVESSTLRLPPERLGFKLPPSFRALVINIRALAKAASTGKRIEQENLAEDERDLHFSFCRIAGVPMLSVDGEPFASLAALSTDSFRVVGLAPCITAQCCADRVEFFFKEWLLMCCHGLAPPG